MFVIATICAVIIFNACKTTGTGASCAQVSSIAQTTASLGVGLTIQAKPELRKDFETARTWIVRVRTGVATVDGLKSAAGILGPKIQGTILAALDFANNKACLPDALGGLQAGFDAALGANVSTPNADAAEAKLAIAALKRRGVL